MIPSDIPVELARLYRLIDDPDLATSEVDRILDRIQTLEDELDDANDRDNYHEPVKMRDGDSWS